MDTGDLNISDNETDTISQDSERSKQYIRIHDKKEIPTLLFEILGIDHNQFDPNKITDSSYTILYNLLVKQCPFTVIVEKNYVDRFYRDSYYLYYASKNRQYNRFCKRLFFFKGIFYDIENRTEKTLEKMFMGSMVIRPLVHGKIGRTLLNPYFFANRKSYMRYATYEVVVLSKQLRIHAFPFSMQDGETTTCAEVTIQNLIDYFSRKYQDYRIALASEIFERVDQHGYERCLPTKGLKYSEISRVFSEVGFYPRLYSISSFQNEYQFKRNMHYYIESGIPVAVGIERLNTKALHSITCIGHGEKRLNEAKLRRRVRVSYNNKKENVPIWVIDTADLFDEYIVMDDNIQPYAKYAWKKRKDTSQSPKLTKAEKSFFTYDRFSFGEAELKNMMVPLSKRMFLEAEDAYDLFVDNLSRRDFGIRAMTDRKIGTKDNPLVMRIFLASSRHFRQARVNNLRRVADSALFAYSSALFPKFVWVCEIYTIQSYLSDSPKVCAELVIDATASSHDRNNVIIYNYGKVVRVSNSLEVEKLFNEDIDQRKEPSDKSEDEDGTEYFYKIVNDIELEPYTHNLHLPSNKYK